MRECLVIGHRGASGLAPENTLLAYRTAIDLGVDMIELDIHETCDGHLVCIHDYEVDRTTDGTGFVVDMSLNELRLLDAGQQERVPLLEDVLELAFGKISVNIELKVIGIEEKVALLVKEKSMINHVIVSSFFHKTLRTIQNLDCGIKTAVLVNKPIEDIIEYVLDLGAIALNPLYTMVTKELVKIAHESDICIYPWTVNNQKAMIKLIRMGVNGIITDFPDRAIETLRKKST